MGQHILLLHGALGSAAQFETLKNKLSTVYTVHTFNFTGHGGATIPEHVIMPQLVHQLQQYIEQNIPANEQLSIFGYSMGGYAALLLASKNVCKIDRIITLGTKLFWNEEIAAKEIKMLQPEVIEQKLPAFALELKNKHEPQDWKLLMKVTADMMLDLGMNQYLNEQSFGQIKIPCKLMLGDNDKMVTVDETIFASEKIKNASMVILENTPHPIEKVEVDVLLSEL